MEVIHTDGKIYVANGQRRVGPFDTDAAACLWIDRHGGDEGLGDYRYNQIRMAVNGSYEPDRY